MADDSTRDEVEEAVIEAAMQGLALVRPRGVHDWSFFVGLDPESHEPFVGILSHQTDRPGRSGAAEVVDIAIRGGATRFYLQSEDAIRRVRRLNEAHWQPVPQLSGSLFADFAYTTRWHTNMFEVHVAPPDLTSAFAGLTRSAFAQSPTTFGDLGDVVKMLLRAARRDSQGEPRGIVSSLSRVDIAEIGAPSADSGDIVPPADATALLSALVRRLARTDDFPDLEPAKIEQLADQMASLVPTKHPYDEQIGPFYETKGVVSLLGSSKQAVDDRVNRGTLLRVKTNDGRNLYPVFQFEGRGVHPAVQRLIVQFRGAPVDGWAVADWLTTPSRALDGQTPVQWVRAGGHDVDVAEARARSTARRWRAA